MADLTHQPKTTTDINDHVSGERLQRLSLIKGEHRWQFRWAPGDEASLINSVAAMARDPKLPFDWYDAAIICKHITNPIKTGDHAHPEN
jgi:hypothetical protein